MNEVLTPTKTDLLGAARGILTIEKSFGIKIEKFQQFIDKSSSLTFDDSRFLNCAENEFLIRQDNINVPSNDFLNLCKHSLTNASNGSGVSKCFISNFNLFHFQVEELWSDVESEKLAIYFVHNFLSDQELSKFETFKTNVDFNHMSKFYNFEEEEEQLRIDGDLKCRLIGTKSNVDFFEGDFEKVENNLHFGREGKIAFLPRHPEILVKTESRFHKKNPRLVNNNLLINFETRVKLN